MRYVDLGVILAYLIGITWFGARFRHGQKSLKDYFLGGRTAPWWAISLSIVSAETSTLTIIGTPALSFAGNLGFLQLVLGYLLARLVISWLLLPHYFRGELYTAYELMRRRFGERIRKLTAAIFLVARALAEGVRVFAISIVISIILGTGEVASIVLITLLTLFYTFEGGMTAVIWTDVVQMCLYVVGAAISFFVILQQIPGGLDYALTAASAAGKLQVFDFRFVFDSPYTFWAGILGGCFLTTASHGTDQLMVQRLLSARNEAQSRAALLASWVVIFTQFTMFLAIGILLWVHYRDTGMAPPDKLDRVYPQFIWSSLPRGVAGIVVAAILAAAMANLSAALNSLASTTIVDFYRPLTRSRARPEAHYLKLARAATVVWGMVLLGIGIMARQWGSVLEAGLTIASIPLGALLGVFLLGVLTRRVSEPAALAGAAAGLSAIVFVRFGGVFSAALEPLAGIGAAAWLAAVAGAAGRIAWTWYVLIGASATFAAGCLASLLFSKREA